MASQPIKRKKGKGYDFSGVAQMVPQKGFQFGPRDSAQASVDASLAKLFQYLTVETSGILVHPQWKHFRHMEMMRTDQIRLSNGIWRSWHIQFQKSRKPLFCQFDINPIADMESHHEPQAIVIEGKYWKRQTAAVACEYRKWRLYYKEKNKWSDIHRMPAPTIHNALTTAAVTKRTDNKELPASIQQMQVDNGSENLRNSNTFQVLEDLLPDSLFSESRQYMRPFLDSGNVLQQPNLGMLNPTLDELLEKLEPMEVMFGQSGYLPGPSVPPSLPSVPDESSVQFFQPGEAPMDPADSQYGAQANPAYVVTRQPPFLSKPVTIQQDQRRGPTEMMSYAGQLGGYPSMQTDSYGVNPSAFLSMPTKDRSLPSAAMDIGTPPPGTGFGPAGSVKMEISSLNQAATAVQGQYVSTTTSPFHPPAVPPSSVPITRSSSDPLFTGLPPQHAHPSRYPQAPSLLPQQQGAFVTAQTQTSPPPSATLVHSQSSPATTPIPHNNPSYQYPLQPSSCRSSTKDSSEFLYHTPSPPPTHGYGGSIRSSEFWPQQENFPQRKSSSEQHTPFTSPPPPPLPSQVYPSQQQMGSASDSIQETNLSVLAEQVQLLEQQQFQQLKEIEKQQSRATQEYLQLLQQYISQSGSHPSQQQQQVLQSVLSDPTTVNILKAILIQGGEKEEGKCQQAVTQQASKPKLGGVATTAGKHGGSQRQGSQVLSPTRIAKVAGVSDFQSRVVMAAAVQAASMASGASSTTTSTTTSFSKHQPITPPPLSPITPTLHDAVLQKFKNARNLSQEEKKLYQEIRRQSHITAEQKRRGSIKQGFEHLQSLVVNPSSYPSGKVSKAIILEKTVEFLQHQHAERAAREKHLTDLKEEISQLNNAIALSQQQLPASGAPITRQRFEENKRYFREYLQERTQHNYKFWLFSIILRQLFESYNNTVSTGSKEELCQTVVTWFEQNCTLPSLRPVVMNALKEISMKTCILSDPGKVPQQLTQQQQPAAAAAHSYTSTST